MIAQEAAEEELLERWTMMEVQENAPFIELSQTLKNVQSMCNVLIAQVNYDFPTKQWLELFHGKITKTTSLTIKVLI